LNPWTKEIFCIFLNSKTIKTEMLKRVKTFPVEHEEKCINTIRVLTADIVEKANSGHRKFKYFMTVLFFKILI
jgi:hypothetical protein